MPGIYPDTFKNVARNIDETWAYGGEFGGAAVFAVAKPFFNEMPPVYGYVVGYLSD